MGGYDDAWDIVTSPCYISDGEEQIVAAGWLKVVNYIHDNLPKEYAMFFVQNGVDEDPRAPAHVDLFKHKFVWNPATSDEFRENKLQRGAHMLLDAMRENFSDVDVQEYASLVLWNLLNQQKTSPCCYDLDYEWKPYSAMTDSPGNISFCVMFEGIETILQVMRAHEKNSSIQSQCCHALNCLMINKKTKHFNPVITREGGSQLIVDALELATQTQSIVLQDICLCLIHNLSSVDDARGTLLCTKYQTIIVRIMERELAKAQVPGYDGAGVKAHSDRNALVKFPRYDPTTQLCRCLDTLHNFVVNEPDARLSFIDNGGCAIMIRAVQTVPHAPHVQTSASIILRYLCRLDTNITRSVFLNGGIATLMEGVICMSKSIDKHPGLCVFQTALEAICFALFMICSEDNVFSDAMIALDGIAVVRDLLIPRQGSHHRRYPVAVIKYATQMVVNICIQDNSRGNIQRMLDQNLMASMLHNIQTFTTEEMLLQHTANAVILFFHYQIREPIVNVVVTTGHAVRETSDEGARIMIRALRLHFENPKLCGVFCMALSNMGIYFQRNFNVMQEMGMSSYLLLALRYHTTLHDAPVVLRICSLLYVFLYTEQSPSNTSRAALFVRNGLADLQHVMLSFLDDKNIQDNLTYILMPKLCEHKNTNSVSDMHAIVLYVLECVRSHLHLHNTSVAIQDEAAIEDQTCTLGLCCIKLWDMISANPVYISIIRMHHGREILEFAQQVHTPFLRAQDDVQDAIAFVNGALSKSDPMTDFQWR